MNWVNVIPWSISGIVAIVAILTLYFNRRDKRLETIAKLQSDNLTQKKKIDEYEDISKLKEKLRLQDQVYYKVEAGKEMGPFCAACFENNHKLFPLQIYDNGFALCNNCKETYVYNKQIVDKIKSEINAKDRETKNYFDYWG
jgi:hypothetical protein